MYSPASPQSLRHTVFRFHADPHDFFSAIHSSLYADEAKYGLMLGIAQRLCDNPLYYGHPPLMITAWDDAAEPQVLLAALMTPPHKLQINVLAVSHCEELAAVLASRICESGWSVPAVLAEERVGKAFAEAWSAKTNVAYAVGIRQRLYKLQQVLPAKFSTPGGMSAITAADMPLAKAWTVAFQREATLTASHGENDTLLADFLTKKTLYFWVCDGQIVAMAARTRPTAQGETVSYVFTPPEHRRRGYATALVRALSQLLLDEGRNFCVLYTDLANPTSNAIYQRIGYRPICDVCDVDFAPQL